MTTLTTIDSTLYDLIIIGTTVTPTKKPKHSKLTLTKG